MKNRTILENALYARSNLLEFRRLSYATKFHRFGEIIFFIIRGLKFDLVSRGIEARKGEV